MGLANCYMSHQGLKKRPICLISLAPLQSMVAEVVLQMCAILAQRELSLLTIN